MKDKEFYQIINEHKGNMSKSQIKIADYILENSNIIPFITGSKLASLTGVSEATVVRFATFLGFQGYNDMQRKITNVVEKRLNTVQRLTLSQQNGVNEDQVVLNHFREDIYNIKSSVEQLNVDDLRRSVSYILSAEKVYIIANRSALSLGTFLQYYLNLILGNSQLIHSTESVFDDIHQIKKNDVVIGISYARYTKSTIDAISYCHDIGANIIALTDSYTSPITSFADISLFASTNTKSFLDSFVAPLSIINVLISLIGKEKQIKVKERLELFESVWDKYNIFYNSDTDHS